MRRFGRVLFLCGFLTAGSVWTVQGLAQEGQENWQDHLPPGDDRELIAKNCTACHDLGRTVTRRQTRGAWERMVRDMIDLGAPIQTDEGDRIAKYLGIAFGDDAPPLLDVNAATREDFMRLPGVSSELADRLVAHRIAHGAWSSREALRVIPGFDGPTFEKLKYYLQVRRPVPVSGGSPQASAAYPADVYPDSGNRLPMISREELDDFGKGVLDAAVKEAGSMDALSGPRKIRMHSPRVADAMSRENSYLRSDAGLEARLVELSILVSARAMDNQYEWAAHEIAGLKAGLEQNVIDIVKYRKPVAAIGEKEAAIIQLGREAFENHKVSPTTFARALKLFGKKSLVDIVALMGNYTATALMLTVFDQQLPPDRKPLLPIR